MNASFKEAQLASHRWELEAKEVVARLEIEAMRGARAQVEAELSRIRRALATAKDARLKAEFKRDVV